MATTMPIATGRSRMVLELDSDRGTPPHWWRVTLSIPGREGTVTRTWSADNGALTETQVSDLGAWLLDTLASALATAVGVQGVLQT